MDIHIERLFLCILAGSELFMSDQNILDCWMPVYEVEKRIQSEFIIQSLVIFCIHKSDRLKIVWKKILMVNTMCSVCIAYNVRRQRKIINRFDRFNTLLRFLWLVIVLYVVYSFLNFHATEAIRITFDVVCCLSLCNLFIHWDNFQY